jgi:hypothetical protein
MSEPSKQAKAPVGQRLLRILYRLGLLIAAGFLIGWVLNGAANALERRDQPAGFAHGVVQGALMPIALPNLAVGKDVPIYAVRNTGRTYKLGYTIGVNACGLVFFGFFFWRVKKLRRASG